MLHLPSFSIGKSSKIAIWPGPAGAPELPPDAAQLRGHPGGSARAAGAPGERENVVRFQREKCGHYEVVGGR